MVAGAAVVVLGVVAIAFAVTGSDSSPNHDRSSASDGSTPVAADVSSTTGSGVTGPGTAVATPATNADGTPRATDAPDVSVPTSPTTRAVAVRRNGPGAEDDDRQRRAAHQQ